MKETLKIYLVAIIGMPLASGFSAMFPPESAPWHGCWALWLICVLVAAWQVRKLWKMQW